MKPSPLFTLCAGAALVSVSPILVKALLRYDMGPTAIALWRCALGALIVFTAAALRRKPLRVRRSVLVLLSLAGVAFAVDLFVWHRSIMLAGAGMATILAATQVFVTALLSAAFFREPLTRRFLTSATVAMAGIVLLVGVGSRVEFTSDYLLGVTYGLATGLAYGVFLVLLRAAGRRATNAGGLVRLGWFSSWAAGFLLVATVVESESIVPPGWIALGLLVLLALVVHGIGWWAITSSMVHVRGAVGGLVLLAQPALAALWGALLFGETLAPLQIAGAAVTLTAIYLGSTRR